MPLLLGLIWGDPIGALLVAGFLRLVAAVARDVLDQLAGAHDRLASPTATTSTARDSFWLALVTLGEGYHNFHHRFQVDYRNGVRWYHFDPTKWLVWTLARLGLARDLRRVPRERIDAARREVAASA